MAGTLAVELSVNLRLIKIKETIEIIKNIICEKTRY
jgi:hypothetical protein